MTAPPLPESRILQFYRGTGTDNRGRRLDDILSWDDAQLENNHDYIQWLFPLPEPSGFNPGAPTLVQADIVAFRQYGALRRAVLTSLGVMRRFYGLDGATARQASWLTPGNHNMLRLTRIIRSLHLLGLDEEAAALLRDLETIYASGAARTIGPVTLGHWRRAMA
jgi:hypothetical protein